MTVQDVLGIFIVVSLMVVSAGMGYLTGRDGNDR